MKELEASYPLHFAQLKFMTNRFSFTQGIERSVRIAKMYSFPTEIHAITI